MKPWLQYCAFGARKFAASVASFALWTLWLGLGLLLAVQLYIASSHELTAPAFVLRRLEEQLAGSGLRLTFGRTAFDPTGRVLVEDVRAYLPAFPDPVFTARAVYLRLNPRMLLTADFEPAELEIMHAAVSAPAQLTPSGRTEEIIGALDTTLVPRRRELQIDRLSARLGGMTISLHGTVPLPAAGGAGPGARIGEMLARSFPTFCRQAIALQARLDRCEQPALHLRLSPSASGELLIGVTALSRKVVVDTPVAIEADNVVATTRLLLRQDAPLAPIDLSASAVRLPGKAAATGLEVHFAGKLNPDTFALVPRDAKVSLDALQVEGVDARSISLHLTAQPLPRLVAAVVARIFDAPLAVRANANLDERTARLRFAGAISPRMLDVVSQRIGVDVRRYYDFEALDAEEGEARFGPGWKFEKVSGRVRVPRMNSYGVIMEDGRAWVELEPGRLYSPEAFARVGENFARGSYEQNLRTREYRFLLEGRLRPVEISPWFGDWWPNFFRKFEFPVAPPEANVDVQGVWREGRLSRIFLLAETPKFIVRGTELDDLRTRLFIRPGWVDGLELLAHRDGGETRGVFAYRANEDSDWQHLDVAFDSSFDLPLAAQLLGNVAGKSLTPYRIATAPTVKFSGRLHGPGAAPGSEDTLSIEARTTGEFRFHEFPLQDVSFVAKLKGSEVTVDRFHGSFAEGTVSGNARVWSSGTTRRVGFNVSLEDANLGQAATTLQAFLAQQKGLPPPPPGRFVQERANLRLNVAASAEGNYDNPLSYYGDGNAILKGAEIGEVPLLGLLSELFTFTSLRFTEARGNFKIDGPKLVFPKIELRGSNSAIDAQGDFTLDRSELNFTAKLFPFQESDSLLKSVVGAVLTPLSNALEVKLTGTFEKPKWAFVMGPRNFLRSLAGTEPETPPPSTPVDPTKPSPEEAAKPPPLAVPAPPPQEGTAVPAAPAPAAPTTPAPPPPGKP